MTYSSNLTDAEWEIFEPLLLEILPTKKRTRPANWTKREIVDGILYQLNGRLDCESRRCVEQAQKWLQLARLAQRLPALLNRLLALQAVASRRGIRATDKGVTRTSPSAGEKNRSGRG